MTRAANCSCSRARRQWRDDGTCGRCQGTIAEVSIMDAVKAVLISDPACLLWRNEIGHNTHFPDGTPRKGPIKYGIGNPGGADLIGLYGAVAAPVHTPARFLAVETKTASGRLSPDQHAFGTWVARRNGVYAVCRSTADARALLAWLRHGGERPGFVFAGEGA
jgi:hypothetical protein